MQEEQPIILKKVSVHNLKEISVSLTPGKLIVLTGVSGSGKSSFAFDTLYTEGQRRYVESLSIFAKRQMGEMARPEMESASGISPTIAIEQKSAGKNPRSTVGTLTEIYDYLRLLFARIGTPHCPVSKEALTPQSRERIIKTILLFPEKRRFLILSPYARQKKAEFKEDFVDLLKKGYTRVRIDGAVYSLEEEISLDGSKPHDVDIVVDRVSISKENEARITASVTEALRLSDGMMSILDAESEKETLFSMHAYSKKSGLSYRSLEPSDFSFNNPGSMCPHCHGLGNVQTFRLDQIIDPNKSIAEDCVSVATSYQTVRYRNIYDNLAEIFSFSVDTPWKKLKQEAKEIFLYGTKEDRWLKMHFVHPEKGYTWVDRIKWRGVLYEAETRFQEAKSDAYKKRMREIMHEEVCPTCHGSRLKPYPAHVQLGGKRIQEITSMTIDEALSFFEKLKLTKEEKLIGIEPLKEINERLHFLHEVGLSYLTLDRTAPTLSGGEAQRVRLASQIGSGLVGITYILDEPSIGLHPRDNQKLIRTLRHLTDIGNTLLVVEHDEETILAADHILDFGPGAGAAGGELIVDGDLKALLTSERSITGKYLTGKEKIAIPKKRRKAKKESLKIVGATHHNLKKVNVTLPLGLFTCITGVSGSGKSSLISDILFPALANELQGAEHAVGKHEKIEGIKYIDKVIGIDQTPIGRTPRSNPATYIKLFDDIRALFASLPTSKARGFKAGRFSFNVREGSCSMCGGMGMVKIDMDFMEEAWSDCPECHGRRFDPETLDILYKGKNIFEVLEMDVAAALLFFENLPAIRHKLELLNEVGLSYMKIGQFSTTLSGGEAQRIKLAKELVRPASGKTLYILDEPTTGLHYHDIRHLLDVLHKLVEKGNSVVVIEHNVDVIKTADWIIDLGPEGGKGGGEIVASGTPEEVAALDSATGLALKRALNEEVIKEALAILKSKKKIAPREAKAITQISVKNAEQNNLKSVSADIPRGQITICTGPSGSGKSSFAFDTLYAEGQRRYTESLSPYARQFVEQMPKPIVAEIQGLSPAIAIEQRISAGNPRSTVGTLTEAYDYLRVIWAHLGTPHCPESNEPLQSISKEFIVSKVLNEGDGKALTIEAPLTLKKNESFEALVERLQKLGFLRISLDGKLYELDSPIPYDATKKQTLRLIVDRLKVTEKERPRIAEAIETAAKWGESKLTCILGEKELFFNLAFAAPSTGKSYPKITPHSFSFNTKEGMCPYCEGIGTQYSAALTDEPLFMSLTFYDLMSALYQPFASRGTNRLISALAKALNVPLNEPLFSLSKEKLGRIIDGSDQEILLASGASLRFRGLKESFIRAARHEKGEVKEAARSLLQEVPCFSCGGARIHALARHVTIDGMGIHNFCHLPIDEALRFAKKFPQKKILEEPLEQLTSRLKFLSDVGLAYLSLDRSAPTLSGGEAARIRLARQLGSGLTGTLYVLDEPTIGLHPHDTDAINGSLIELKEKGNSLVIVEHDPQTIAIADQILDFGPGAGAKGGEITARGTLKEIEASDSLTGLYLSGRREIPLPKKRRKAKEYIEIKNARLHNLKNLSLSIPVGVMTCLTGVSGSGKSTLMQEILLPAAKKALALREKDIALPHATLHGIGRFTQVISIDQLPVGHTIRSQVATYSDVSDRMRSFFAQLPEARARGLDGRYFSSNHRRGMCSRCWGLGFRRVEMHFLPAVRVPCEECNGLRLNQEALSIHYKGKNFGEYLGMTVDEVRAIFEDHPRIVRTLDTLIDVGLGYLKLGQEVASLSSGEAQRIKLSRELSKRKEGEILYLLDEPTTGLHFSDIDKLLKVLHKLVDKGHTMVIVEHNLDMIKNADHLIDLGPLAGAKGGELVATGTPEEIAKCKKSLTGSYLNPLLINSDCVEKVSEKRNSLSLQHTQTKK